MEQSRNYGTVGKELYKKTESCLGGFLRNHLKTGLNVKLFYDSKAEEYYLVVAYIIKHEEKLVELLSKYLGFKETSIKTETMVNDETKSELLKDTKYLLVRHINPDRFNELVVLCKLGGADDRTR